MQLFGAVTESYSDGNANVSLSQQNVSTEDVHVTILARSYVTYKIGERSILTSLVLYVAAASFPIEFLIVTVWHCTLNKWYIFV